MSKLSEPLKAFINAAHARPHTTPAPKNVYAVYERIAQDAQAKSVGLPAWLCASTAATMTLNSPDSLLELYRLASSSPACRVGDNQPVYAAEFMREVGLKCIGINGVPRVINTLGAFYAGLPKDVQAALDERKPRRRLSASTLDATLARGNRLWDSIYRPLTSKLTAKLAQSHPDLPVVIVEAEYGSVFADPEAAADASSSPPPPSIGRVLTSVMAIACLRAQSGVGPQVVSHVFGLRKAFADGSAEPEADVPGGRWLATNDGSLWLLELVDRVVAAVGEGRGTTFAPGLEARAPKAKL